MKTKYIVLTAAGLLISLWMLTNATAPIDSLGSQPTDALQMPAPQCVSSPPVPSEASFCGERVPLERADVYEALDRELIANTFLHSNTLLIIKRTGRYFPIIEPILKEMGVPDDLKYLCCAESNLVPNIKSPVGAGGLWQFMESTAKEYGLTVNNEIDERFDLEKSTRAACRKMLKEKEILGSWAMMAAAYNGGLTRVKKNKETQQEDSYYDIRWAEETGRYVFRILALKEIITAPDRYGFQVTAEDMYAPYPTKTVSVSMPMGDVAQWAKEHGTTYKSVRMLNPSICNSKIVGTRGTMDIRISAED